MVIPSLGDGLGWLLQLKGDRMEVRRIAPNIATADLAASREFYTAVLGLEVAMDRELAGAHMITCVSPSNVTAQVSLIQKARGKSAEVPTITVEVSDIDGTHARAEAAGLTIVYPLTTEPWGVRRFHVVDPSGVTINVMKHVPG